MLWIAGIAAAVLIALLARLAFDVLVLLVVSAAVLVLERTVGDWLADALGPFLSKVVFVGIILLVVFVGLSIPSVRKTLRASFESADELGLHSVIISGLEKVPVADTTPPPSGGPRGSATSPAPPSSAAAPEAPAASPTTGTGDRATGARTRVVLRIAGQGRTVVLQADVVSERAGVDEGNVEFTVDGTRVAVAPVSAGRAEARTAVTGGSHRVQARFTGTATFRESFSEAAFTR